MNIQTFNMDTRRTVIQESMPAGIAQSRSEGIAKGFSGGAYQNRLKTAKLMKQVNCGTGFIMQMTGLSKGGNGISVSALF